MADNYDELLRELDKMAHYAVPGLEQSDTSRLASAAIRALQAENAELRVALNEVRAISEIGKEFAGNMDNLRAALARVTAERDEARGGLASIADALNTALRENHHDAGQVRSIEWQAVRDGVEYLAYHVHAPLRARLAALREKAEALEALEAWGAPEADACTISWMGGEGGVSISLSGVGHFDFMGYKPLHEAIRAALAQAEGRK